MPRYLYPNLCTIYAGSVNGREFDAPFREHVCYGSSLEHFTRLQNDAEYNIILITDYSYVNRSKKNYCWMTKHQLENYLRRISTIKPFKYHVEASEFNGSPCFKVNIKIHGTKKETTFVLQCIKRVYEWPYNFFLQQAYELQGVPEYKFESILNLYNVVASTYWSTKNCDHSFSINAKFEKYKTLREKLPHVKYVVDLYPDWGNETKRAPKLDGICYYDVYPSKIEEWDDVFFAKMLPFYERNYNALKR